MQGHAASTIWSAFLCAKLILLKLIGFAGSKNRTSKNRT